MTTKTLKEILHDVAEVKILKANIRVCQNQIEHTFGKTESEIDQNRATLVVLKGDFFTRKDRIMKFIRSATPEEKNMVLAAMKEQ